MKRLSLLWAVILSVMSWAHAAHEAPSSAATRPAACIPAEKNPEQHEAFLRQIQAGKVGDLLFLGDSITAGWRNGQASQIFEKAYGKYHAANFGIGGDQTQHVLWRLENGELDGIKPRVIVLIIGTNNLGGGAAPQDAASGVRCIVETIRAKLPDTKVLLLGVFPRSADPSDPMREKVRKLNELIAKLDDTHHVKYLDIGDKFLDGKGNLPREVFPDGLHPNAQGYLTWADAMQQTLDEMMKPGAPMTNP